MMIKRMIKRVLCKSRRSEPGLKQLELSHRHCGKNRSGERSCPPSLPGWRQRRWHFCWCEAAYRRTPRRRQFRSWSPHAIFRPGTRLTPALLILRPLPPNDIPEGAAKTPAVFAGKITTEPIAAGSAVTDSAVTAPSAALGMAFSLPPTLRAVTVATDPADGGADLFVRPEDHVDILATDEPGGGPASARTVLQNVRLLAVGGNTSSDPPPSASSSASGAAHVTVAVTPAQAQMLVLAAARGHLHLALRAIGDGSETPIPVLPAPAPTEPVRRVPPRPHPAPFPERVPKMMPLPPLPVVLPRPAAAPPAPVSIVIIKGTVSQTVTVAP